MAISYAIVKKGVAGNMRINVVDITLDGSYAAGGYALTAASLGVGTITSVHPQVITSEGIHCAYNPTTGKLQAFKGASTTVVTSGSAAFTELAVNDTIISASTKVRCTVIGDFGSG